MAEFNRRLEDPLVEGLLLPAILRVNRLVKTQAQARLAVDALRNIMANPDPLEANRRTLETLRDGVPVVLTPGEPAVTVKFFAFDPDHQNLNDFTVTNQYSVHGTETVRADTVLLVNGVALVLAEYKSYVNSGKDWREGVNQLHRYQREAPALLTANVFAVSADEQEFRYGPVAFQINSQRDIDLQRDHWRPWLSQYPRRRGYWNLKPDQLDPDRVKAAVDGLLLPCNVLDFLQHFTVFETKKGKTVKKVARYQQFEAANDLADRVLERVGQPDVKTQDRTGLIWHTQGSGKSLTMIYAGAKLRRHPKLASPTVMIVVDRRDLKTQLGEDFENCDYRNVVKALGVDDLKARIKGDRRETIITTLQCFQQMEDLEPLQRDNTILLIDECHRSQKGVGYATTMRVKLPNAFRFGFTGTPIDKTMVNTHRDFGPIKDGKQERYLSYYSIRQAIKDGATLEVYFQFRPVPLAADETVLDTDFEKMCAEMELEDEEEKDYLQRKEVRWKALARHPERVAKIIENMVTHFLEHPDPSGFKAQLVCIERAACVQYKEALDAELKKRGILDGPAWSEVIISAAQNDPPELERFHYEKTKTDDLIDYFKLTPAQWETWNRKQHGDDKGKWKPPLKILIVCDRLLTGFDAPIEQVMYLDKPLRDHNLLQAMARTNRPLTEMGKRTGVIVDYFGVFKNMQKALNFSEDEIEDAVIDWEKLKAQVPDEIGRCMKFFEGIKIEDTRDCLMACLQRLAEDLTAHEFEAQFKRMEVLWEAIAPDECLYPHRKEYAFLCTMFIAHRRRNRRVQATHEELAAKTRDLIQEHTTIMDVAENLPVYKIDANYLTLVHELPTPADKAAELEAALTAELIEGDGGFLYKKLGERLELVLTRRAVNAQEAAEKLRELEALVREVNVAQSEPERLGLTSPGEWPLYTVVCAHAKDKDEGLCVKAAKKLLGDLRSKRLLPRGWSTNAGGRKNISLALQVACWDTELMALDLCPTDVEDAPFLAAAVDELARTIE